MLHCHVDNRNLHSFPTRRSSDLIGLPVSICRLIAFESCSREIRRSSTSTSPSGFDPAGISISPGDRKSTRLNSSHITISYAVFCLKKNNHHPNRHVLREGLVLGY